MENRKGQAAMEFLMTYGWAILAALIAIAVLAYFGVFSPSKLVPDACTLNAPLGCEDSFVNATGDSVNVIIRNNAGGAITATAFTLSGCTGSPSPLPSISDGGTNSTVFTGCGTLTAGDKFKGTLSMTYDVDGGSFSKTATGSVTGKAQ